jgi:hypothetical protein
MTDTISPDTRPLEVPSMKSAGIPDEWFRGYVEGNNLLPQANGGIVISTLKAVLDHPPASWNDLWNSSLSKEQIDELGAIMTRAHLGQNIQAASDGVVEEGMKTIGSGRLERLWGATKEYAIRSLKYYAYQKEVGGSGYNASHMAAFMPIAKLDAYTSSQKGGQELGVLKSTVSDAIEILKSPEGREFLEANRRTTLRAYRTDSNSEARGAMQDRRDNLSRMGDFLRQKREEREADPAAIETLTSLL